MHQLLYAIETFQGDSLGSITNPGVEFLISDDGIERDITGYTIECEVKPARFKNMDSVLSFTTDDGSIDLTGAVSGKFVLLKSAAAMNSLEPFENYVYDIRLTSPEGIVETPIIGTWTHTSKIIND